MCPKFIRKLEFGVLVVGIFRINGAKCHVSQDLVQCNSRDITRMGCRHHGLTEPRQKQGNVDQEINARMIFFKKALDWNSKAAFHTRNRAHVTSKHPKTNKRYVPQGIFHCFLIFVKFCSFAPRILGFIFDVSQFCLAPLSELVFFNLTRPCAISFGLRF